MSYLLSCKNTNTAMELFKRLDSSKIKARVVPTPSSLGKGCGLSFIVNTEEDLKKIDICIDIIDVYQLEKNSNGIIKYNKMTEGDLYARNINFTTKI